MFGSRSKPFSGTLYGEGFTLSNIAINSASSYIGFTGVNNGTIKGLILNNINISGGQYVGGMAGENTKIISDSIVKGNVTAEGAYAGLISTLNENASYVVVQGNVTASSYAGGLVSYLDMDKIAYGVNLGGSITATAPVNRICASDYYGYGKKNSYANSSILINGATTASATLNSLAGADINAAGIANLSNYVTLGFNTTDETKDYIWYIDANGLPMVRPGNL